MDCSRCSATAAGATDRVAAAQDTVADSATERDGVAAREYADAANKCSGVVAAQIDNGLSAVAEFVATAAFGSRRSDSHRGCDQIADVDGSSLYHHQTADVDGSNRDCDQTAGVVAVAARVDVALRLAVAADAVAPSVAAALASFESALVAAVRNDVAALDSRELGSDPDAVVPSAVAAPENCESGPDAVVRSAAGAPVNCESAPGAVVPNAVVVPDSHAVVLADALPHAAVVLTVAVPDLPVADFGVALVLLVVPAGVVLAQPGFARCAPGRDRAGPAHRQR